MGWVWPKGSNLAPGPLGSVAGDPDRPRGAGQGDRHGAFLGSGLGVGHPYRLYLQL
jgi:hypothetical protein